MKNNKIYLDYLFVIVLSWKINNTSIWINTIKFETQGGEVNNNSRSSNHLDDYSTARITINGTAETISVTGSSGYYTRAGIPVGTASISVDDE